jgi:aspartate/methionine/tyrosine aminotransferase
MMTFDLALGTIAPSLASKAEDWKTPFAAYGPRGGFAPLRSVLAEKEGVSPTCITVTSGSSMALTATLATLPKNRAVLVPRPYYPAYPNMARFLGLEVPFYDLAPGSTLAEAVSDAACGSSIGAILVNTPGNPLGNLATADDIKALEKIAHAAGAILIVDETYAGIFLDSSANAWSGAGAAPGVVRLKSLSKTFLLAGERIGYAVTEPVVAAEIEEAHWVLAMSPAVTAQTSAARALLEDVPERLPHLCAQLRRSRDCAVAALAAVGVDVSPPPAGIFLWIVLPGARLTGIAIAGRCREDFGISVMPGEVFGQCDPPVIRACFALPESEVNNAFQALGNALCELNVVSERHLEKRSA